MGKDRNGHNLALIHLAFFFRALWVNGPAFWRRHSRNAVGIGEQPHSACIRQTFFGHSQEQATAGRNQTCECGEIPLAGDFHIARRLPVIVLTREHVQLDWFGFPLLVQFDKGTISGRVRNNFERMLECLVRFVCLALFDKYFEEVIAVRINLHHSAQLDRFHSTLGTVRHDTDGLEYPWDSARSNYRSYNVRTRIPNRLLAGEVAVCDIEVFGIFWVKRCAHRKNIVLWLNQSEEAEFSPKRWVETIIQSHLFQELANLSCRLWKRNTLGRNDLPIPHVRID